mmetsp:Transcript_12144/g.18191  ORF Transcript_12144/g.18191 Transcript_12144/m.18191 type:complete len:108 (+) Transcript_12144:587-910(+)
MPGLSLPRSAPADVEPGDCANTAARIMVPASAMRTVNVIQNGQEWTALCEHALRTLHGWDPYWQPMICIPSWNARIKVVASALPESVNASRVMKALPVKEQCVRTVL